MTQQEIMDEYPVPANGMMYFILDDHDTKGPYGILLYEDFVMDLEDSWLSSGPSNRPTVYIAQTYTK